MLLRAVAEVKRVVRKSEPELIRRREYKHCVKSDFRYSETERDVAVLECGHEVDAVHCKGKSRVRCYQCEFEEHTVASETRPFSGELTQSWQTN